MYFRSSGMKPVNNPNHEQPFLTLSNQVRKMFWNANISIGGEGVTTLNWEAHSSIYPNYAI